MANCVLLHIWMRVLKLCDQFAPKQNKRSHSGHFLGPRNQYFVLVLSCFSPNKITADPKQKHQKGPGTRGRSAGLSLARMAARQPAVADRLLVDLAGSAHAFNVARAWGHACKRLRDRVLFLRLHNTNANGRVCMKARGAPAVAAMVCATGRQRGSTAGCAAW